MEQHSLTFGPFQLNGASGTLLREGEPLRVGQRGIRLLEALLQRRGEVLTKAELMDAAWPDTTIEEANLSVQIMSLRKALGPAPGGGEWIVTIPRVGYRFVPEAPAGDDGNPAGTDAERPDAIDAPWWPRLRGYSIGIRGSATLAAAVLAAVVGFAALRSADVAPPLAVWKDPSIAVLPFDDMSGNPELSYFGDGVGDDIISMLARVPELHVVARNSSFRYKGQAVDIRQVGEELGATHVLEGSVRRDADRLRIVAQLVDTRTGKHVWAERFDRTGTDPWALQDEVTERIVATLVGNRGMIKRAEYREAWGKDSANLHEYDYFLRATDLMMRLTQESLDRAIAICMEGLARFPDSSLLKVQGAVFQMLRPRLNWSDTPEEDFRQAGLLAREALAEPNLSPLARKWAHYALAYVSMAERAPDQAIAEAELAIALAPHDGGALSSMIEVPIGIGQSARALEWIDRAGALFPENDIMQSALMVHRAWALTADRQWEPALAALSNTKINALQRAPAWGRYIYILKAIALAEQGRLEEARAEVRNLLQLDPTYNDVKFRMRNMHFDPELVEWSSIALSAAGLPQN